MRLFICRACESMRTYPYLSTYLRFGQKRLGPDLLCQMCGWFLSLWSEELVHMHFLVTLFLVQHHCSPCGNYDILPSVCPVPSLSSIIYNQLTVQSTYAPGQYKYQCLWVPPWDRWWPSCIRWDQWSNPGQHWYKLWPQYSEFHDSFFETNWCGS